MNEPETIVIGGKRGLIDCLYDLQTHYNFDMVMTAKTGTITLQLKTSEPIQNV